MENIVKIIVVECSDIMLNGILTKIQSNPGIEVAGYTSKVSQISDLIENSDHDLVLFGPMINEIYEGQLLEAVKNKYPFTKIVGINYSDYPSKIEETIYYNSKSVEI